MKKILTSFLFLTILINCCFGQKTETLKIDLPVQYQWKVAVDNEDSVSKQMIIVSKNQNIENWKIVVEMITIKIKIINIDSIINTFTQASLQESTKAKISMLEKSETGKYLWTIFKVETPNFPNDSIPESQLWYAIQGKSLHVNFVAVKQDKLDQAFVEKWSTVFKNSKLMYE